jgi:hypothetical protein
MDNSGNRQASAAAQFRARSAFNRLHRRAIIRTIVDRLFRRPTGLRRLAEEAPPMATPAAARRTLTEVCLDEVVGSVNRPRDYTSTFLPRVGRDEERWAQVRLAIEGDEGLPPLELYEVNGKYYVLDGHHRVSVFKSLKVGCVEAYVTPLPGRRSASGLRAEASDSRAQATHS